MLTPDYTTLWRSTLRHADNAIYLSSRIDVAWWYDFFAIAADAAREIEA
jgi:hypothetical protein